MSKVFFVILNSFRQPFEGLSDWSRACQSLHQKYTTISQFVNNKIIYENMYSMGVLNV